jgi:pimeloyl-ACP methyl ester carboxylesterase
MHRRPVTWHEAAGEESAMPAIRANGITIEYEEIGDPRAPAIVLIMGLRMQLITWPDAFCHGLADRGFRVIRFDNRDVGHSTKFHTENAVSRAFSLVRLMAGGHFSPPYTLHDMAADTIGVLDALAIERAHIIGASMGGMIGQIVAAQHPNRVRSLVSIMSSSGDPTLPHGSAHLLQSMLMPALTHEQAIRRSVEAIRAIGSPGFPVAYEELHAKVVRGFERSHYPPAMLHHILAIAACGSRVELLRRIKAPTLVIHGADDPLVPVAAGKSTAQHIPGARLQIISGMGHDLPSALLPMLVSVIAEHCHAADRTAL